MSHVEDWNLNHPVGTPVRYFPHLHAPLSEWKDTYTKSKARLLANTPVVLIEGHTGAVALSHVVPVTPGQRQALDTVAYITELVDNIPTEQVDVHDLQDVLTEIHCACQLTDERLNVDSEHSVPSRKPGMLRRGMDILDLLVSAHEAGDIELNDITDDMLEKIQTWRANAAKISCPPLRNPTR